VHLRDGAILITTTQNSNKILSTVVDDDFIFYTIPTKKMRPMRHKKPSLQEHVSESDDEEIDEDCAFNSDDERLYGSIFAKKTRVSSEGETESDMEERSDSEDRSIGSKTDDDEDDDDDNENIDDGGQYMLDLLNKLDANPQQRTTDKEEYIAAMKKATNIPESEFSSTMLGSDELTMDQLLNSIAGTQGFQNLKQSLKGLLPTFSSTQSKHSTAHSSRNAPTPAPVARVLADRATRKVHYEQQVANVSTWIDTVKQHREAETLDFRPLNRIRITKDELVGKFEPSTEFEREIAMALEQANATHESDLMHKEEQLLKGQLTHDSDELGNNTITMEEFRKRQGQLAKLRALLFYEENKRHHINKIKSKKYRKIRKKMKAKAQEEQNQFAAQEDPDFERQLEEKEEMERARERMSLAHKNTSKWAKRVLKRGKHVDLETRRALSEQLRIGDSLRHKMMSTRDSAASSDEDEHSDDDQHLIREAEALYQDIKKNTASNTQDDNKLLNLAFMKKGVALQRERALQEARQLLSELEANDNDGKDNDEQDLLINQPFDHDIDPLSKNKPSAKTKSASKKELETVLENGKFVAKGLSIDRGSSLLITGPIELTTTDANPWITLVEEEKKEVVKKNKKSRNVDVQKTVSLSYLTSHDEKEKDRNIQIQQDRKPSSTEAADVPVKETSIANLSQSELVRLAFAAPSMVDIDDEFEQEKVR
jgi:U3 small nucleolar RNA-associated protein 14